MESISSTLPYHYCRVHGSLERKRFSWALEILREIIKVEPKLVLAACGFSRAEADAVLMQLPEELKENVILLPFVEEESMPALYRGAVVVLYPTLYEGFGLPVVEAIASGTPIVFSALGSLAEFQGPGAIVIEPYNRDAWVSAVVNVARAGSYRNDFGAEGRRWAQKFSWHESARKHFEIYSAVANF